MAREMDVIKYDDPAKLPAAWQVSEKGLEAINVLNAISTTNGLYANIPIICKGDKCPYVSTCTLKAIGMSVEDLKGQRCPVEVDDLMKRFQWYVQHFEVEKDNVVDLGMIKELVDIDIMLERAGRKMAQEADFIEMVCVGIDADGNAITRPEIRKSVDFKERMQKRKDTLLSLMNATRKDKAGNKVTIDMDPSSYAAYLISRKAEIDRSNAIEVEVEPVDEEPTNGESI